MSGPPALARRSVLKRAATGMGLLATTSCGWILYPERNGRRGGAIDVPVMVIDLLWLLPGLVPGIICLAVDFTTGCIYRGSALAEARPAKEAPPEDRPDLAEIRLDGAVVARGRADDEGRVRLVWEAPIAHSVLRQRGELRLAGRSGAGARGAVRDLI